MAIGERVVRGRSPNVKVSRPLGRPRKGKSSTSVESEFSSSSSPGKDVLGALDNQLVVFDPPLPKAPPGVMTRARAALAMGIQLGLTYDCSDEETLQSITTNIRSRRMG